MDFKSYITENSEAKQAMKVQHEEIIELLKILDLKIKKNMTPNKEIGQKINWGHVGSMGHVITSLRDIIAFLG